MSLRKFDVFPKLDNEFRVGTTTGGFLTILSLLTVIILSISEIVTFLHPETRQRLAVDMRKPTGADGITIDQDAQPKLDITLNITFPSSPCYLLHLDVIDPLSQLSMPLENINHKFNRLNKDGKIIGEFNPLTLLDSKPVKCGSCYKANSTKKLCCNTCKELFDTYEDEVMKPPRLIKAEQCKEVYERTLTMDGEGCSIFAEFTALRVASEFHVAPGYSWNRDGWHIHDIKLFNKTFADVNLTHTIHEMRFSKKKGYYPLDGTNYVQNKKLPTRTVYIASILEDNFSSTYYNIDKPKDFPSGIYFQYDVSPITAQSYIDREPFTHLLTRLLTVIGATLGLFRFIDTITYKTKKSIRKEEINQ